MLRRVILCWNLLLVTANAGAVLRDPGTKFDDVSRSKRSTNPIILTNAAYTYTQYAEPIVLAEDVTISSDFGAVVSIEVELITTKGTITPPSTIHAPDEVVVSADITSKNKFNVTGLSSNAEYIEVLKNTRYSNSDITSSDMEIIAIKAANSVDDLPVQKTMVISLVPVTNTRPTFTSPTIANKEINEDTTLGGYIPLTLAEILFNNISDDDEASVPDDQKRKGVAVLHADNSHGFWSYYQHTKNWRNITSQGKFDSDGNLLRDESLAPSGGKVFLMVVSSTAAEFLRFLPDPNFTGSSTITFVAWDRTGATSSLDGGLHDVAWTADSTAFSTETISFTFDVLPVQDRPILNPDTVTNGVHMSTFVEDESNVPELSISSLLDSCSDPDMPFDSSILNLGIVITSAEQTSGDWMFKSTVGGAFTKMSSYGILVGSNGDVSSQKIKFIPNKDFSGTAKIYFKCWDFTDGATNGDIITVDSENTAYSTGEGFGYVTITPINDAPTFTSMSDIALPTYPEDPLENIKGSTIDSLLSTVFHDADPGTPVGVAVTNMVVSQDGQFEYTCDAGITWNVFNGGTCKGYIINPIPQPDIATLLDGNCKLRFMPTPSFSFTSPSTSTLTLAPWDQTDGTSVGAAGVATDASSDSSAYGSMSITLIATYTEPAGRPILSSSSMGSSSTVLSFIENDAVALIFPDIVITKLSSETITSASVLLSSNHDADEQLVFGSSEAGKFTSESHLTSTTTVALTWINTAHTELELSGGATLEIYQQALQSISYKHTSDNPTAGTRTVLFKVTDGSQVVSNGLMRDISVTPVNDAPVLSYDLHTSVLWNEVQFTQGGAGIEIFSKIEKFQITDPDNTVVSSMTLQLSQYSDAQEKLYLPTSVEVSSKVDSLTKIVKTITPSSTYDVSTGRLTIALPSSSSYTLSDYAGLLKQVKYINEEAEPRFQDRIVEAFVTDPTGATSSSVIITIQLLDTSGNYRGGGTTDFKPLSPSIVSAVAVAESEKVNDVDVHTDAKYGNGDSITISFNFATNMAPFGYQDADNLPTALMTRHQVDQLLSFSSQLAPASVIDAYSGQWTDAKTLILKMNNVDPVNTPKISEWTVSSISTNCQSTHNNTCIRDYTSRSNPSQSTSPPLGGNWGLSIPLVEEILVDNGGVPTTIPADWIGDGSKVSYILQPAFTDDEISYFCNQPVTTILGTMDKLSDKSLTASISNCYNNADGGNTVSIIVIVLTATGPSSESFTQEEFKTNVNIDAQATINTSSYTTGVSQENYYSYKSRSITSSPNVYSTYDDSLTPTVFSSSIIHNEYNETENGTDYYIRQGDTITIIFDRPTDQPAVSTKQDLDKIFSFDPLIPSPGYTGAWVDHKTLNITLLAEPLTSTYQLKLKFKRNQLLDLTEIPENYADNTQCLGTNICGTTVSDANVGICDTTMRSCRANGDIIVSFVNIQAADSSLQWWWILLLCIISLISWIIVAWLGRKLYLMRVSRKTVLQNFNGESGSFFQRHLSYADDRPSSEAMSLRPTSANSVGNMSSNNNNNNNVSNPHTPIYGFRKNKVGSLLPTPQATPNLKSPSPLSLGLSLFGNNEINMPTTNVESVYDKNYNSAENMTNILHDFLSQDKQIVPQKTSAPVTADNSDTPKSISDQRTSEEIPSENDDTFFSIQSPPPSYEVAPSPININEHLRELPGYRSMQGDVIDVRNKIVYDRSNSRSASRKRNFRFSESELRKNIPHTPPPNQSNQKSWPSIRDADKTDILRVNKKVENGWTGSNEATKVYTLNNNHLKPEKFKSVLTPVPSPKLMTTTYS